MFLLQVSVVQQSESAVLTPVDISPLSLIFFPFRIPQSIKWSSLGCTVGSYQLPILYIVVDGSVYTPILFFQCIPSPLSSHNAYVYSLHLGLYFCFANKIICIIFLGEGNGNPLQYSRLENLMDGGAWQAVVHRVAKSRTRLSDFTFTFPFMQWRRKWQPTPVFLSGECQGQGSLVGCRLWGRIESDTTEVTQQQQQTTELAGGEGTNQGQRQGNINTDER